jgi:hypothetical protein
MHSLSTGPFLAGILSGSCRDCTSQKQVDPHSHEVVESVLENKDLEDGVHEGRNPVEGLET